MNFASYAQMAIDLANIEPYGEPSGEDLRAFVAATWPWIEGGLTEAEVPTLRQLHTDLRAVMTAGTDEEAADLLNRLLRENPVRPEISGHPHGDEPPRWHLHLSREDVPATVHAGAVCTMGLAVELLDIGMDRRGVCDHTTCADVYLDGSPGRTRRYCSDSCQNRANVAAYRARKRAEQRTSG